MQWLSTMSITINNAEAVNIIISSQGAMLNNADVGGFRTYRLQSTSTKVRSYNPSGPLVSVFRPQASDMA